MSHTPGPWSVTEDVVGRTHVDSQYSGPGRDYTPVADIHQGKDDARLIAAAPELLGALRLMTDRYVRLVESGDCGSWDPNEEEAVKFARAVLIKSTS